MLYIWRNNVSLGKYVHLYLAFGFHSKQQWKKQLGNDF